MSDIVVNLFMIVWLPVIIGVSCFLVGLLFAYLSFVTESIGLFFVTFALFFFAGLAFYFLDWAILSTVVSGWLNQAIG